MEIMDRKVFLSGPMTGLRNHNVGAFADAHAMLKEAGATWVYDPAIEYLRSEHKANDIPHEQWMLGCIRELTKLNEDETKPYYDVLVQMPGWRQSDGATKERDIAVILGIDVCELSDVRA